MDAGDNQVTVIGDGNSSETAGDETGTGGSGGDTTDGQDGTGSGNQTDPGVEAPVDTTGNQVTIIGDGNSTEPDTESGPGDEGPSGDTEEPGDDPSGDTGGDTPGDSPSNGAGTDGSDTISTLPQGAPAAILAGSLPQTGAPANLVLWGGLGLAMLMLGLVLLASQRRRPVGIRTGREVHPVA